MLAGINFRRALWVVARPAARRCTGSTVGFKQGLSERQILAQFRYTLASFVSPTKPGRLSTSTRADDRASAWPRLAVPITAAIQDVVLERARLSPGFNPPEVVAPDRPQKPVAR